MSDIPFISFAVSVLCFALGMQILTEITLTTIYAQRLIA